MASITVTLTGTCPSQGHLTLAITGDRTGTIRLHIDDVYQLPVDNDTLTISSEDINTIIDIAVDNHFDAFSAQFDNEEPFDGFPWRNRAA